MKKTVLLFFVIAIISMLVISAQAAVDYITFEWRQDSILMRWDGPKAASYSGHLCIQKIKPFSSTTSCIWDTHGRYTTQNNVWFIIPYSFTVGAYRINSGSVAAYDAQGHVIASQTFRSSATWKYYDKDYLPVIRKNNPYP